MTVRAVEPQLVAGVCRYCGCTREYGCAVICWWIDDARTVCSAPACLDEYFRAIGVQMQQMREDYLALMDKEKGVRD